MPKKEKEAKRAKSGLLESISPDKERPVKRKRRHTRGIQSDSSLEVSNNAESATPGSLSVPETPKTPRRRSSLPKKDHIFEQASEVDESRALAGIENDLAEAWEDNLEKGREFAEQEVVRSKDLERFLKEVDIKTLPVEVQDRWAKDPERVCFENMGDGHQSLQNVWKLSMYLYRCSPFAFISPALDLYYDGTDQAEKGADPVLWSKKFCIQLSRIITHVAFRRSQPIVTYFIRFAVACRLRTCEAMRPLLKTTCSVLTALEISASDKGHNVHNLHCELRDQEALRGAMPSIESDILYHLGTIVTTKWRNSYATMNFDHYPVRLQDLESITQALDTYDGGSHHAFFPRSRVMHKSFTAARRSHRGGPARKELQTVHVNAWLEELCRKYTDGNGRGQDSSNTGSVVDLTGDEDAQEVRTPPSRAQPQPTSSERDHKRRRVGGNVRAAHGNELETDANDKGSRGGSAEPEDGKPQFVRLPTRITDSWKPLAKHSNENLPEKRF